MTETDRRTLLRGAVVTGAALPDPRRLRHGAVVHTGPGRRDDLRRVPSGRSSSPPATVPVGGGVILTKDEVVVTQPEAGTFKAFSAVCTHQGCLVGLVDQRSHHLPLPRQPVLASTTVMCSPGRPERRFPRCR